MLRALVGRMPLATRMVAAALILVLMGLLLISAASVMFLRNYLTSQVDEQVKSLSHQAVSIIEEKMATGPSGGEIKVRVSDLIPSSPSSTMSLRAQYVFESRLANGNLRDRVNTQTPKPTVWPVYPHSTTALNAMADKPFSTGSNAGGQRWRVMVHPLTLGGSKQYLVVSASMDSVNQTISRLISIEVIVGAAVLVLLAIVGAAVVTYSLRPLRDIERTAGSIANGNLGLRVPERDPRTELGRLGRALNAMLGQIEAAFAAQAGSEYAARRSADSARRAADAARESAAAAHRSEAKMRRFIADASHELRTPLTTIRGFAELYRQRLNANRAEDVPATTDVPEVSAPAARPEEADRLMARIEAEASRMGLLVEDLLMLARMDQQRPIAHEPVDLLAVAADVVSGARAVAPERDMSLRVGAGADGPPVVLGDEPRLRQVLRNLVDNAMAHTPAGTPVEVRVRTEDGTAVVEVADQGPGLTAEQRDRVFERFYRVDKARSREAGGTGLGLAIVASLVTAHRGTVEVDSEPGEGATFRVRLPLAPDEDDTGYPPSPEDDDPGYADGPEGDDTPGNGSAPDAAAPWYGTDPGRTNGSGGSGAVGGGGGEPGVELGLVTPERGDGGASRR
nr:HAMP domain-containing sensor histidine kinase [Actinocatenispora rupis]